MKNIWKILSVLVALLTMVACPAPVKEEPKTDPVVDKTVYVEYPKTADVSLAGKYQVTLVAAGISRKEWGADASNDKIKVVLATKDVVAKILNKTIKTEAELFTDANKCYVYSNNEVDNGIITIKDLKNNAWVQPAGKSKGALVGKYTGVVFQKQGNGDYKVLIDLAKFDTAAVLAKGEKDEATDTWGNAAKLVANGYIPLILGSVTANIVDASYPFVIWNAGVAVSVPSTATYPTTITQVPPLVIKLTLADLDTCVGTLNGWDAKGKNMTPAKDGVRTFEWKADAVAVEFKFSASAAAWDYQAGSETAVDAAVLGTEYPLAVATNPNAIKAVVVKDTTYVITLTVAGTTVKAKIANK